MLTALNATLAERLMEQTRVYKALQGVRGRVSVDIDQLKRILSRFSVLIVEQPRIKEIDINPLLASSGRLLALDARVVLHGEEIAVESLPHPAIRPYPIQYVSEWNLKYGTRVVLRPIRPEDEPLMAKFHEALSERSVYLRYFHMEKLGSRIAHERLLQKCFVDYDREIALVADHVDPETKRHEIIAVGRLTNDRLSRAGEVAVLVADRWQKQGLGLNLLHA